jgi:ABC-type Na+ efflux pump permease subunit
MNSRLKKILPYIALLIASAYLYYLAGKIDYPSQGERIGPDFWPKIILMLLGATCAYEIVKNLLFDKPLVVEGMLAKLTADSGEEDAADEGPNYPHLLAAGIGLTILYVLTVGYLGFFLATTLYMALFMYFGRYRRLGVIAAASLLGTLVLMFVFLRIVYVSLPIGTGPFANISGMILQLMGVK